MIKKAVILVIVVFGLVTFFVPLVRIQAPLVGTQKISGWDVVKPGEEKQKKKRADLGLGETLDKLQGGLLRKKQREAPVAVKQAYALAVTLPLSYLALVLAAVFVALRKSLALQLTAAIGLLAGAYSVVSVYWLNSGVKVMIGQQGTLAKIPLLRRVAKSAAAKTEVSPELGLYLLAAALALLLLASFLPAGQPARPAGKR